MGLKSTTPNSRLMPPLKLPVPTLPGKLNMELKRDFHSIPQGRHGLLTCQNTFSMTQISTLRPQPQLRRSSPTKLRLKPPPKPLLTQMPPPKKPPQLSFNSTEEEPCPKRETKNQNPNPNLNQAQTPPPHPTALHQDLNLTEQCNNCIEEKLTFSDREFVFKEFK